MNKHGTAMLCVLALLALGAAARAATGTDTIAQGVNDSDTVVGYYDTSLANYQGFIETSGNYTTIDVPGSIDTAAEAINNAGTVVGFYSTSSGAEHSFIYASGHFTYLNDPMAYPGNTFANGINNQGVVSGYYLSSTGFHGFTYSAGTYTTVNDPAVGATGTFLLV